MIHKPCGFLSDAERPVHLVAADPVLAVGDHPDCGEPLTELDRAILEDRSDFGRELATGMLLFAFPDATSRDKARIGAPAGRAMHAIRPAQFDHCAKRDIRVREIAYCLDESLGFGGCVRHTDQYDSSQSLCQVYYYPNLRSARPVRRARLCLVIADRGEHKTPVLRRATYRADQFAARSGARGDRRGA